MSKTFQFLGMMFESKKLDHNCFKPLKVEASQIAMTVRQSDAYHLAICKKMKEIKKTKQFYRKILIWIAYVCLFLFFV